MFEVLGDCIKSNIAIHFNAPHDLISEKYGIINVKSSKLLDSNSWSFGKKKNSYIPDYYVCLGFNYNKTKILHVWFIPGNSIVVSPTGINIKNLDKFKEYEVSNRPYNKSYRNLDIYSLPEFENYNKVIIQDYSPKGGAPIDYIEGDVIEIANSTELRMYKNKLWMHKHPDNGYAYWHPMERVHKIM